MQYRAVFLIDYDTRFIVLVCDRLKNREWLAPFAVRERGCSSLKQLFSRFFKASEERPFSFIEKRNIVICVSEFYGVNHESIETLIGHNHFDVTLMAFEDLDRLSLHPVLQLALDEHHQVLSEFTNINNDLDDVVARSSVGVAAHP